MSDPVVWVLLHDLSRTGVPTVLSRILSGLPPERTAAIHVIARHGGPLNEEIAVSCATVTVLEHDDGRSVPNAAAVALRTMSTRSSVRTVAHHVQVAAGKRTVRGLPAPDVVVVNGAGGWPLVSTVPADAPVVLHLHELETAFDRCIEPSLQRDALRRASTLMVVSGPVGELARRRGARPDAIVTVPGVVGTKLHSAASERSDGARWVMGAGAPGWRKATDRAVALAWELRRSSDRVSVGWVGGRPSGVDAHWVEVEDPVAWYDARPDPWSVLDRAEVIVVPSREDPLPLVALEAGQHRKAVVATATGGLPQLLREGKGLVVGHDLRALVEAVRQLLDAPALVEELGAALADHVRRNHSVEVIAPQWLAVVDEAAGK